MRALSLFVLSMLFGLSGRADVLAGAGAAHDAPEAGGPVLVITTLDPAASSHAAASSARAIADEERGAALALTALPDVELARLSGAFDALVRRLELRGNPLVEDLADGEPADALLDTLVADAPALAAAYVLASRRVVSGDGLTAIEVAPSCPSDHAPRCVSAWSAHVLPAASPAASSEPDPLARRARFFTWAISLAGVIELDDDAAFARARDALRASSARANSPIALVVSAADVAGAGDARHAAIREKARRVLTLASRTGEADTDATKLLRQLAREPPVAGPALPWLTLSSRALLVVPRMSAIARTGDLESAVTSATKAAWAQPKWLHHPLPL